MSEIANDTKESNWDYKYNVIPLVDKNKLEQQYETNDEPERNYWEEYKATALSNLGKLLAGVNFAWIVAYLPELLSDKSQVQITMEQSVWVINSLSIGTIPGTIIGSILANRIGRRNSIILTSVPFFLTPIIFVFSTTMMHLCTARFFAGVGVGAVYSVIPMYIVEIASPEIRGMLSISYGISMSFGIFLSFVMGACVSMRTNALICTTLPIIMCILTYLYLPESPYYYILKQDFPNAEKTLKVLRRKSNVMDEVKRMADGYEENDKGKQAFTDIFTINTNRRAMLIISVLLFGMQCNGGISIMNYSQVIFNDVNSVIPPRVCGVILSLSNFVITILTGVLIDRLGRRKLLMSSCLLSIVPLIILALYFYLQNVVQYSNIHHFTFVPLLIIICIKFSYGIGIGPLPFIVLTEIFPTGIKAQCGSVATIYSSVILILGIQMYQTVLTNFGYSVTFTAYVVVNIVISVFIYFMVPETKGLSLEEIQQNQRKNVKA